MNFTSIDDRKIRCVKCKKEKELSEIIELTCNHCFCWGCIDEYLKKNLNSKVKCPEANCKKLLNDVEKRKILSDDDVIKYDNKCLAKISSIHKCLLPQCEGIVSCTTPDTQYKCSICTLFNCVSCQACHASYTCEDFRSLSPEMKTTLCQEESARAGEIYQEKTRKMMREDTFASLQIDSLPNDRIFVCSFCTLSIAKGAGLKLKNCCHEVCKPCFVDVVLKSKKVPPLCPRCADFINDEEIQSVLSHEELLLYQNLCENIALRNLDNHFCCQARDCGTLHHTAATTTTFTCTKCGVLNCVPCKAVHAGMTCQQYQQSEESAEKNDKSTQEQIRKGDIWPCIVCNTYLKKVSGCNWVQCSSCKTELCWINRMRRWGPGGRDDTSGGCKCSDSKRCHPKCSSCIPHG